VQKDNKTNFLL